MIAANEIRKGNFFNVPNEKQCPFRVDEIEHLFGTFGKFGQHNKDGFGHPLTWNLEDLSPIPLTDEWLLKLGFLTITDKVYSKKCNGVSLVFYPTSNDMFPCQLERWELDKNEPTDIIILRETNFVHQLQNLFWALCGQELETTP